MQTQDAPQNQLDPRVRNVWRIQTIVGAGLTVLALIGVIVAVTLLQAPPMLWMAPVAAAVLFFTAALGPAVAIRYARWRWEVTEDEVRLQHGLFVIQRTIIPMVRVQHVDTSQGPIMRAFDLSEVRVWTAAGSHSIPALSEAEASKLRDRIAVLARVSDDGGV